MGSTKSVGKYALASKFRISSRTGILIVRLDNVGDLNVQRGGSVLGETSGNQPEEGGSIPAPPPHLRGKGKDDLRLEGDKLGKPGGWLSLSSVCIMTNEAAPSFVVFKGRRFRPRAPDFRIELARVSRQNHLLHAL